MVRRREKVVRRREIVLWGHRSLHGLDPGGQFWVMVFWVVRSQVEIVKI